MDRGVREKERDRERVKVHTGDCTIVPKPLTEKRRGADYHKIL